MVDEGKTLNITELSRAYRHYETTLTQMTDNKDKSQILDHNDKTSRKTNGDKSTLNKS